MRLYFSVGQGNMSSDNFILLELIYQYVLTGQPYGSLCCQASLSDSAAVSCSQASPLTALQLQMSACPCLMALQLPASARDG